MLSLSRKTMGSSAPPFILILIIFPFFASADLISGSHNFSFYKWLLQEGDYYRAIGELRRIQWNSPRERWFSIEKEILRLYQLSGHIDEGLKEWSNFSKLHGELISGHEREWLLIKTKLLLTKGDFSSVYPFLITVSTLPDGKKISNLLKEREKILLSPSDEDRSPLLAGILSAVIPGAGQWYAGLPGNGIFTFLVISALGGGTWYLYSRNSSFFPLTLTLTILFYAGNIYGAVTSTCRMNLIRKWKKWEYIKEKENFNHLIEIKTGLPSSDRFLPGINFTFKF